MQRFLEKRCIKLTYAAVINRCIEQPLFLPGFIFSLPPVLKIFVPQKLKSLILSLSLTPSHPTSTFAHPHLQKYLPLSSLSRPLLTSNQSLSPRCPHSFATSTLWSGLLGLRLQTSLNFSLLLSWQGSKRKKQVCEFVLFVCDFQVG